MWLIEVAKHSVCTPGRWNGRAVWGMNEMPAMLEKQLGLNISLERLQLTSSRQGGDRKCALEWLDHHALSSTPPAMEGSEYSLGSYSEPLLAFFFYWMYLNQRIWRFPPDSTDRVPFKCFFVLFCFVFFFYLHSPGPCVPPPPQLPCVLVPRLLLVAVQMALCWCFTMGLRSVCLCFMPSTHSNFSTPDVGWLFS